MERNARGEGTDSWGLSCNQRCRLTLCRHPRLQQLPASLPTNFWLQCWAFPYCKNSKASRRGNATSRNKVGQGFRWLFLLTEGSQPACVHNQIFLNINTTDARCLTLLLHGAHNTGTHDTSHALGPKCLQHENFQALDTSDHQVGRLRLKENHVCLQRTTVHAACRLCPCCRHLGQINNGLAACWDLADYTLKQNRLYALPGIYGQLCEPPCEADRTSVLWKVIQISTTASKALQHPTQSLSTTLLSCWSPGITAKETKPLISLSEGKRSAIYYCTVCFW